MRQRAGLGGRSSKLTMFPDGFDIARASRLREAEDVQWLPDQSLPHQQRDRPRQKQSRVPGSGAGFGTAEAFTVKP